MENHPLPTTTHHQSTPTTPITVSNPNNPYPTTFVQADTTSFKQVVQLLTGSTQTPKSKNNTTIPLIKSNPNKKPSKLYERRKHLKNFKISPLVSGLTRTNYNHDMPEILSPSLLDFPSLVLSPVTPLIPDPFNGSPCFNVEAEQKAIAEKGFYLYPSPVTTPRKEIEPQLLPLFPVTSPKFTGSSTS